MAPATSPPTRTSAWVTRWMRAIMTGGIVWHLARLVRNIRGRFLLAETPMHRRGPGRGRGSAVHAGLSIVAIAVGFAGAAWAQAAAPHRAAPRGNALRDSFP